MAKRIMYIRGSGDVVSAIGGSGLCALTNWRLGDLWFVVFVVRGFVVLPEFAGVCRALIRKCKSIKENANHKFLSLPEFAGR